MMSKKLILSRKCNFLVVCVMEMINLFVLCVYILCFDWIKNGSKRKMDVIVIEVKFEVNWGDIGYCVILWK